jgi:uncharacterized protein (DUF1800 family)
MAHHVEAARRHHRRRRHTARRRRRRSSIPTYSGRFGAEQAERLLWRAGFGPRPGEAKRLARKGLDRAVESLTRPGAERLRGPSPKNDDGHPLAPYDAYGHDQLWWLDKMVRTRRPLIERMTLVWHDWFATSNDDVGSSRLMIGQNKLFRRRALGSFKDLLLDVTKDPAMLLWLSGSGSSKDAPNENYGREMMELFTIGVGRYSEHDVREQARSLTGFTNDWDDNLGPVHFRFDREQHDDAVKKVFGKRGRFDWRDSCRLCLEHKSHPSFFVEKLWSYFIPTPPSGRTRHALERMYVDGGYDVRPLVEAILRHPALYNGPRMVKPPIVYTAGLLRGMGRGIDTEAWVWLSDMAGQQLFYPPDVAGWVDDRWLDTATWRGRWLVASYASKPKVLEDPAKDPPDPNETAAGAVDRALAFWGNPLISRGTRLALERYAERCKAGANREWKQKYYPLWCQNALRMMIATSPDLQTC